MNTDSIAEIGIDDKKRVYLRPGTAAFGNVCGLCMEVDWDPVTHRLTCQKQFERSYLECFEHLMHCALLRSCDLNLTTYTVWVNVPDGLRKEMKSWCKDRASLVA